MVACAVPGGQVTVKLLGSIIHVLTAFARVVWGGNNVKVRVLHWPAPRFHKALEAKQYVAGVEPLQRIPVRPVHGSVKVKSKLQ